MGKRCFLCIIVCIIFLGFSCGSSKAASDKTETLSVMNAYMDVLKSNAVFYLYTNADDGTEPGYQGENTLLSNLLKNCSDGEHPCQIKQFTVIDMDGDGVPEVIAELPGGGEKIVFHYENGKIYGFSFSSRGLQSLKQDGTFISTGGADYIYLQKLQFSNGVCKNKVLAYTDTTGSGGNYTLIFYINDEKVSEDKFSSLLTEREKKEAPKWYVYSESSVGTDFAAAWHNAFNYTR